MPRHAEIVERMVAQSLARAGIGSNDAVLVGLSGGPDSVAMVHALRRVQPRVGFRIVCAHLNHQIRGAEADSDERFVRELCQQLGLELIVDRAENLMLQPGNLEERARELRHDFLNRAADQAGASLIALAHHGDDQAETVLLRLLRGSGIAGLGAMRESGPGRLFRPLLMLRRGQLLDYLAVLGADYRVDSSNLSIHPLRNRIRHHLLPMLERDYARGLSDRLCELAAEARSVSDRLAAEAVSEFERRMRRPDRLDLAGFAGLDPVLANATMREWLRLRIGDLRHIRRQDIDRMAELCATNRASGAVVLPRGWRLWREYDSAILGRDAENPCASYELPLACIGETEVVGAGAVIHAKLHDHGSTEFPRTLWKTVSADQALFDADRLATSLTVRSFRPGDRIQPLGMTGRRKLQDVFVDQKVPRTQRRLWPLVASDEAILWVPGLVRGVDATVSDRTRRILSLRVFWRERAGDLALLGKQPAC